MLFAAPWPSVFLFLCLLVWQNQVYTILEIAYISIVKIIVKEELGSGN